jgi:hypothetical protein
MNDAFAVASLGLISYEWGISTVKYLLPETIKGFGY